MAVIQIADIPDALYQQIEALARARGKTVAEQAADFLARGVATDSELEEKLLENIRIEREKMAARGVFITEADIEEGKNWGRK